MTLAEARITHDGCSRPHHSGQRALADAGLFEAFLRLIRPGQGAKRIADKDGSILLDRPGNPASSRPEVDRGELRKLLIGALPEDTVRWGRKVSAVSTAGGGKHRLDFADGTQVTVGLLVGADGTWSRSLVPADSRADRTSGRL